MRKAVVWAIVIGGFAIWVAVVNSQHHHSTSSSAQSASHHRRIRMHYTAEQQLLIREIDVAAGKSFQAASSPDGTYEGRTSDQWCSVVLGLSEHILRGHSLKWSKKVDRATDGTSRMLSADLSACT